MLQLRSGYCEKESRSYWDSSVQKEASLEEQIESAKEESNNTLEKKIDEIRNIITPSGIAVNMIEVQWSGGIRPKEL
jgi:hypothetical protein